MQILIYHNEKFVKFLCFFAINPQITCKLSFILASSLPAHTFCGDPRDRSESFSRCAELMTSASRKKKTHRNNAIALNANRKSGGRKYSHGSYLWQFSRGLDLDFPTWHYIISALSSGEYGENDQLAGRSERARFWQRLMVITYTYLHVIRFAQLS